MKQTFGTILKQLRLERAMSQDEFAKLLGTTKQVISRYEKNQRTPKITVANEYAKLLGVPLNVLLGEVDSTKDLKKPAAQVDDELLEKLSKDPNKLLLMQWIAKMDTDQLERVIKLLDAALLQPRE